MKIVIIKYNAGNIRSVDFALQRLGISASVTAEPDEIRNADRVIFPGVGEASTTMSYLKHHKLDTLICNLRQPVLGVCLGLQLMCAHSEEGDTECLGIFPEKVRKFIPKPDEIAMIEKSPIEMNNHHGYSIWPLKNKLFTNETALFKVPHMGWNSISGLRTPLFENVSEEEYFYFVHSYYATTGADTAATCDYLVPFSAALQRDNFYATQFHPEKSGKTGAKILENFINLKV